MATTRRRMIENYSLHQLIGQGVYGKVYKAKHKHLPDDFAIKVIPNQLFSQNKKLQECTINQINTLSSIKRSPHIVKYIEMLKTPNNFYFVYEFCNGGTLEGMLKKQKMLSQGQAMEIFKQLLKAFKVLHSYNIMHRDIKPDNILFHNGEVKLGDFGFCKNLVNNNDMTATMLGSPIYMAPQVLKGQPYTSKADIWSLGVVLFEMLFGYCPYQSNSIANLISTIKDTQLRLPVQINNVSEDTQKIIKRMLIKDQRYRIQWKQIFQLLLPFESSQESGFKIMKLGDSEAKIISSIKQNYQKQKQKQKEKDKYRQKQKQRQRERQKQKEKQKQKQIQQLKQKQKENPSPYSKKFSYQNYREKQKQKQKQNEIIRSCSVDKKLLYEPPSITSSISSSLNWQTDQGFKKFLANKNLKSINSKFAVDSSLPIDIHSSANKLGSYNNFFTPSSVTGSISTSSVDYSNAYNITNTNKRRQIVQQHQFCTKGIKTSIDIINVDDRNTIAYSYIILIKIQSRLRKITQSINSPLQPQYQDVIMTIDSELRSIEKSIQQLREELMDQGIDFRNLEDPKIYLGIKFKESSNIESMRVWYDMVNILFGSKSYGGSRDKEKQDIMKFIKQKLCLGY